MFGTIISDIYSENRKRDVAEAIDGIAAPTDSIGWSSSGIYCYWHPHSHEILYIGIAVNLSHRFSQHNGLSRSNSCKFQEISTFFKSNKHLGVSLFMQSPIKQPRISANSNDMFENYPVESADFEKVLERDHVHFTEGVLIEAWKKNKNKIPRWNKIGSSKKGQIDVKKHTFEVIINALRGLETINSKHIMSRCSIRELASDNSATELRFEENLQPVREYFNYLNIGFDKAFEIFRQNHAQTFPKDRIYERMLKQNYFAKKPNFEELQA